MKKITVILLGTLIASSAVLAQSTNQVLSRNAVGYVKKTVGPSNKLDFVTMPFNSLAAGGNALSNVIPSGADSTAVILWNPSQQSYITLGRAKGSWGLVGSNVISRGQSFFIRNPATTSQVFFLMGEVPDKLTAPTTTVSIVQGISAVSVAYPVDTLWTSTAASSLLLDGDQLIVWDDVVQNYITYGKAKGSWSTASNLVVRPGQGLFMRKFGTAATWNQVKPYTWP